MDAQPGNATPAARAAQRSDSSAACEAFRTALDAYFLGLPGAFEQAVEQHAADCSACAGFLTRARELSCRDFVAFLDDYLEEALAPDRRATFERHLALCDDCVRYLQSYEQTSVIARSASEWQLPPRVPAELVLAILKARQS